MKHLLLKPIAAVVLVGCGPSMSIHEAATDGNIEAVKQHLDAGAEVNAKNIIARTPLDCAMRHSEIADLLRKHGGKYGSIHTAAAGGDTDAVKEFLADVVDVNAKDETGRTPLLLVGIDNDLHHVPQHVLEEIAELLIAKGADLEAKTNGGHTLLHNAASYNHKGVAELLIANGADVNARANNLNTPLDSAISYKRFHSTTETADLLRKHGGKTKKELKAAGK